MAGFDNIKSKKVSVSKGKRVERDPEPSSVGLTPIMPVHQESALSTLSDERITAEILIYKDQVGYGMIELGRRLIEMKKRLGHGKFLDYLAKDVEFSRMNAYRFMRMAGEESNVTSMLHLGFTKVYALLDVHEPDREDFINTPHQVETKNGIVEKTVEQMTVKELNAEIKKRKDLEKKSLALENTNKYLEDKISILTEESMKKSETIEYLSEQLSNIDLLESGNEETEDLRRYTKRWTKVVEKGDEYIDKYLRGIMDDKPAIYMFGETLHASVYGFVDKLAEFVRVMNSVRQQL